MAYVGEPLGVQIYCPTLHDNNKSCGMQVTVGVVRMQGKRLHHSARPSG